MDAKTRELILEIGNFFLLAIIAVGVVGNSVAFVVCSRSKLKTTVFSVYFRFVAFIDTITLLLNPFLAFLTSQYRITPSIISNDWCRFFTIFMWAPTATTSWILMTISLDRLISIKFPARFLIRKKRWFQLAICFVWTVKDFIYYSQSYFSTVETVNYRRNGTNKTFSMSQCVIFRSDIAYWLELFNSCLIPSLFMFTCTVLILKSIFVSNRKMNQSNQTKSANSERKSKFAISAISVNMYFFLTVLSASLFLLFSQYIKIEPNLNSVISKWAFNLYYSLFASTFYINVTVNSIFRDEFLALICCSRGRSRASRFLLI
jgi:hypothetical protein